MTTTPSRLGRIRLGASRLGGSGAGLPVSGDAVINAPTATATAIALQTALPPRTIAVSVTLATATALTPTIVIGPKTISPASATAMAAAVVPKVVKGIVILAPSATATAEGLPAGIPSGPPPPGPVTLPVFEDFEAGPAMLLVTPDKTLGISSDADISTPSTLNTSFTDVDAGGAVVASFEDANVASGRQALSLVGGAGGGKWLGAWRVTGSEFFARTYLLLPNAAFDRGFVLAQVTNVAGDLLAGITIADDRTVQLINRDGQVVAVSQDPIPINQLTRIEWHLRHGGDPGTVSAFYGDSPAVYGSEAVSYGPVPVVDTIVGEVRAWTVSPHSASTANIIISAQSDFGSPTEVWAYWFGVESVSEPVTAFLDAIGLRSDMWCGPAITSLPLTGGGYLLGDYRYKLYVRSPDLVRIGEIDTFDSASYAIRHNAVGGWIVSLPSDSVAADLLSVDRTGIQIVRDGEPLISGPARTRHLTWDPQNPGGTLEVSGPDDLCWIAGRVAVPDPAGPPYSTIYDTQTGLASTVIRHYVDVNAGPSAMGDRVVPGFTLAADPLIGTSVFGRARFLNLLDLISALALAGGDLGFKVTQVGLGLVFSVFIPIDRSQAVSFSIRRENVLSIEHEVIGPEANYIIAGGDGTGLSRTFRQFGDGPAITAYGRIEDFLDQRGTTDVAELKQAIQDELDQRGTQEQITVTATDTEAIAFGRDYNLGDKVSAIAGDVHITDLIREIDVDLTGDGGEQLKVTVGSPGAKPPDEIAALLGGPVHKVRRRVDRLERSD